jgi:hypothetical protein
MRADGSLAAALPARQSASFPNREAGVSIATYRNG